MSGYPEPIHLLNFSNWLASVLGVSTPIGEILASMIIVGVFLLICLALRTQLVIVTTVGLIVMMGLTGLGWIPVYVWILIAVYIAILFARNYKGLF